MDQYRCYKNSVLGPLLLLLFINVVPKDPGVRLSLFADNTAAFAVDPNAIVAVCKLRNQFDVDID